MKDCSSFHFACNRCNNLHLFIAHLNAGELLIAKKDYITEICEKNALLRLYTIISIAKLCE